MNRLMEHLKVHKPVLASNEKLAARAGVSSNTIGRMRRGSSRTTVGKLSQVAKVVGYTVSQLLTPGFDPTDPPELVSDKTEKRLLQVFRERIERGPDDTTSPPRVRLEMTKAL